MVRYEDLSVDPYRHVKELYNFYGLDFHVNVKKFLDTHTKNDVGGVSSTFRNSKVAPFHWRTDLDFEEVDEIQRVCAAAMRLWDTLWRRTPATKRISILSPTTNYNYDMWHSVR